MVAAIKLDTTTTTIQTTTNGSFSLDRKTLKKRLDAIVKFTDAKSTIPVLAHVFVDVTPHAVTMTATDLNVSAIFTSETPGGNAGSEPGAFAFHGKELAKLVGKMPDGLVRLTSGVGHRIEIASGHVRNSVAGISTRDRVRLPSLPDESLFRTIDAQAFNALIEQALPSVCKDETRFHLNGICLEGDATYIRAISTDGHRLTRITAPIKGWDIGTNANVILPSRAASLISKVFAKSDEFRVCIVGPHMFVCADGWTVIAKLIDAKFPPYDQVIPKEHTKLATIERAPFIAALERAKVCSSETRGVRLATGNSALKLSADNGDGQDFAETFPCDHGKPFVIGFNATYLLDALKLFESATVTLAIGAELDPGLIRSTDDQVTNSLSDSPLLVVVMPMRL